MPRNGKCPKKKIKLSTCFKSANRYISINVDMQDLMQ